MSNNTVWAPARKFPGYEVSKNHLVRNIRTKNVLPQRRDPFDSERRPRVTLIFKEHPVEVFVQELVNNTFGEGSR
jgi:hypothetical protein